MPEFSGIHHVAITVSDLEASAIFYEKLWSQPPVGSLEGPDLVRRMFRLPDGTMVGLTQHGGGGAQAFNPRAAGLDHLGFAVADRKGLQAWQDHLEAQGMAHSGIVEDDSGLALNVKDPDGTALEFFVAND
ncbi:VOC family protein [Arthrobacter rhombi]|uniref:VOC family protein n=1 Tax=Arthrobacter rhombi TaxID=71253 RepID=UPI003FD51543